MISWLISSMERFVPGKGVRTGVDGTLPSVGEGLALYQNIVWLAASLSKALCRGPGVSGIVPAGKSIDEENSLYVIPCLVDPGTVTGDERCTSILDVDTGRWCIFSSKIG
jgi:hypothetical protein